jgi:rhodanese-related sulfurtransferase
MKNLLRITALSTLLATSLSYAADTVPAAPAVQKAPASNAHILKRAEIDNLLATPEKVLLIDVRRPDEVTSIGGFPVYLSIQLKDLEKSLAFIPKDRIIVLVSNHAGRAGKAADLLTAKGFNVAGAAGVEGYEAEGGVIAKIVPPIPKQASATAPKAE